MLVFLVSLYYMKHEFCVKSWCLFSLGNWVSMKKIKLGTCLDFNSLYHFFFIKIWYFVELGYNNFENQYESHIMHIYAFFDKYFTDWIYIHYSGTQYIPAY